LIRQRKVRDESDESRKRNLRGEACRPCRSENLGSREGRFEKFTSVGRSVDHDTSPQAVFPRFLKVLLIAATSSGRMAFYSEVADGEIGLGFLDRAS
jgi:hypothetical protein